MGDEYWLIVSVGNKKICTDITALFKTNYAKTALGQTHIPRDLGQLVTHLSAVA
jgi:hypothetical protein